MMNYIWAGMILLAYIFALFTGRIEAVTQGALDGAKKRGGNGAFSVGNDVLLDGIA